MLRNFSLWQRWVRSPFSERDNCKTEPETFWVIRARAPKYVAASTNYFRTVCQKLSHVKYFYHRVNSIMSKYTNRKVYHDSIGVGGGGLLARLLFKTKLKSAAIRSMNDLGRQRPFLFSWPRLRGPIQHTSQPDCQSNAEPPVFSSQARLVRILSTPKGRKAEWTLLNRQPNSEGSQMFWPLHLWASHQ